MTETGDYADALSAGGIVMIIIAGVGILTAFTTILCMFIMARKRANTESRLQSALQRNLANSRHSTRGRSNNLSDNTSNAPTRVFTLSMFPFDAELPKYDDAIKFPPSYEEALRMSSPANTPMGTPHGPLSPTTSLASNIARTGSEASDSTAATSSSQQSGVTSSTTASGSTTGRDSPKPGRSVAVTIHEDDDERTNRVASAPVTVPKIEVTAPKDTPRPSTLNLMMESPRPSTSKVQNSSDRHKKSDSGQYGDAFNV